MDIQKIFHIVMMTPGRKGWGLNVLWWGLPGEAKTSLVERFARSWGLDCEVLSPGERGEGAFGVTPVPEKGFVTYPPPDWSARFLPDNGSGAGLVFLDELNTAAPALQAPLLGLLNERRLGGTYLGPRVRMMACSNDAARAAGGWNLAASLANRMGHLDWPGVSLPDWTDWMQEGASLEPEGKPQDIAAEEARVVDAWPSAWVHASSIVTSFLQRHPGIFRKIPAVGDPQTGRAWPSPRTWEFATRALAGCYVHHGGGAEQASLVSAFVGQAASKELFTFAQHLDLPDPGKLLDGEVSFRHDPHRLDRTMVVLASCAATVSPANAPKRKPRADALWDLLAEVQTTGVDLVIQPARVMSKADLHHSKRADPTLLKVGPILEKMNRRPR